MTSDKWRRLKEFIKLDIDRCKRDGIQAGKDKQWQIKTAWVHAGLTNKRILSEMARLEKEER